MKKLSTFIAFISTLCLTVFMFTACNAHTHEYSTEYSFDNECHWYECDCGDKKNYVIHDLVNNKCACGYEKIEEHTHMFNKEIINDSSKKSDATCTEKAKYYYSCECGEVGNETFEVGFPLNHDYGAWESNDDGTHSRICKNDTNHKETENCSGGTATEEDRAICTVCNSRYGAKLNHTHSFTEQIITDKFLVTRATCTEKAVYFYSCKCGEKSSLVFEYGVPFGHLFVEYVSDDNSTYESDGTKTAICSRNGCDKTDTVRDVGSRKPSNFSFNNCITVNDKEAYVKVNSSTSIVKFSDLIEIEGVVNYSIYKNDSLTEKQEDELMISNFGENKFYVLVSVNEIDIKYTVIVYRKNIFTVDFNTNFGSLISAQEVEEDGFVTKPIDPIRTGYQFSGWDFDFNEPVKCNFTINAGWIPNSNTSYKIEYYLQNLDNDEYTLQEKETVINSGITDSFVKAGIKTFAHFIHEAGNEECGEIIGDGSLVLKVYYKRAVYKVRFNPNGGNRIGGGNEIQNVKYGDNAVPPIYSREGYDFIDFNESFYSISTDIVITAMWKAKKYSFILNANGGYFESGNVNVNFFIDGLLYYSKTIESGSDLEYLEAPNKNGYIFVGWYRDKDLAEKFVFKETIIGDLNLYGKYITSESSISLFSSEVHDSLNNDGEVKGYTCLYDGSISGVIKFNGMTQCNFKIINQDNEVLYSASIRSFGTVNCIINVNKYDILNILCDWDRKGPVSYSFNYIDSREEIVSIKAFEDELVREVDYESIIKPDVPKKNGMIFVGWVDSSGKQFLDDELIIMHDLILYAKWEAA